MGLAEKQSDMMEIALYSWLIYLKQLVGIVSLSHRLIRSLYPMSIRIALICTSLY
jgi:hypothetical protein